MILTGVFLLFNCVFMFEFKIHILDIVLISFLGVDQFIIFCSILATDFEEHYEQVLNMS